MRVVLFFIDGLGLGPEDGALNPLVGNNLPNISRMLRGRKLAGTKPIDEKGLKLFVTDAVLGVEGIPQSATGQTSLLTGINAQAALGYHLNGFPNQKLRELLMEHSVLKKARELGFRAEFINAFTLLYWRALEAGVPCQSATTISMLATGQKLRDMEDLSRGRAVYQDITNRVLLKRGFFNEVFEPERSGRNLGAIASELDLTLYEYYLTDRYAHKGDRAKIDRSLDEIDRFLGAFWDAKSPETTLVISSDHGNVEDLGSRDHTFNPVPTIVLGPGADMVKTPVKSLTDIAPMIIALLREK